MQPSEGVGVELEGRRQHDVERHVDAWFFSIHARNK
jgi:hypothetical protein